jgi:hypothetical protein
MSSSATDVLASVERPVVYGSQGGIEPATMEWLVIERSGRAVYSAANPWPRSAPYDEIGTWAADAAESLGDVLAVARHTAAGDEPRGDRSFDAGLEYLDLFVDGRAWSGEWVAQRSPAEVADLVDRLRTVIDDLRAHPVSTLKASLLRAGDGVRLRLENRGSEPFRFRGFGKADDASCVHGRIAPAEGPAVDRNADDAPVRLAAEPCLNVPGPTGNITLNGGDAMSVDIDGLEGEGRVECLVHLRFETENVRGERYVEDGWIWPHALTIGGS